MNLGGKIKQLGNEARRTALVLCLSHLALQAVSTGVHMDTTMTHCQGVNNVQETKGQSKPKSCGTSDMNFAFSLKFLKFIFLIEG